MNKSPIKALSQQDYVQSAVRFPPALRDALKAAAAENGRSFNAEVLARLQDDRLDAVMAELAQLKTMMQRLIDRG